MANLYKYLYILICTSYINETIDIQRNCNHPAFYTKLAGVWQWPKNETTIRVLKSLPYKSAAIFIILRPVDLSSENTGWIGPYFLNEDLSFHILVKMAEIDVVICTFGRHVCHESRKHSMVQSGHRPCRTQTEMRIIRIEWEIWLELTIQLETVPSKRIEAKI